MSSEGAAAGPVRAVRRAETAAQRKARRLRADLRRINWLLKMVAADNIHHTADTRLTHLVRIVVDKAQKNVTEGVGKVKGPGQGLFSAGDVVSPCEGPPAGCIPAPGEGSAGGAASPGEGAPPCGPFPSRDGAMDVVVAALAVQKQGPRGLASPGVGAPGASSGPVPSREGAMDDVVAAFTAPVVGAAGQRASCGPVPSCDGAIAGHRASCAPTPARDGAMVPGPRGMVSPGVGAPEAGAAGHLASGGTVPSRDGEGFGAAQVPMVSHSQGQASGQAPGEGVGADQLPQALSPDLLVIRVERLEQRLRRFLRVARDANVYHHAHSQAIEQDLSMDLGEVCGLFSTLLGEAVPGSYAVLHVLKARIVDVRREFARARGALTLGGRY